MNKKFTEFNHEIFQVYFIKKKQKKKYYLFFEKIVSHADYSFN